MVHDAIAFEVESLVETLASLVSYTRGIPCRETTPYLTDRARDPAESVPCGRPRRPWRAAFCSTRSWATSSFTAVASPTASCPTEPASAANPVRIFATLNAHYSTAAWQTQIEQAASIWEQAANLNLAVVSDGGEPVGTSGDQQDDPRFGDIRIGAVPLGPGTLAVTFLPPPSNGGTDSGDILLNSNINWQINSNYDLMTVMAHEFGHALGLGDVSSPTNPYPVMYGDYEGINQALTSDDIAGIQAVDGVRQFDAYNVGGKRNLSYMTAANISSSFRANAQLAIPSLDITTGGDSEWFYVTVPSTTTGTMTVTVQSSNLSSLSPKLMVYTSSLGLVGQAWLPIPWGRRSASAPPSRQTRGTTSRCWPLLDTEPSAAMGCWLTPVPSGKRRFRRPTPWSPSSPTREAARLQTPLAPAMRRPRCHRTRSSPRSGL